MTNRIVVGIDGSTGARSALLWAADECRVRQRTLLVVHAPDSTDAVLVASSGEPAIRALDQLGERLLNEHAAAASARQPGVPVTTLLSHAAAADALVDLSADTDLLVVGTHGRGGNLTSILGSVSHRAAAHAHCPVAVVPEQLALRGGTLAPRIVVGVSATVSGRHALEFALDEARRRGASLVAVRAWGEPDAALVDELDPAAVDRWKHRAGDQLRGDLAPLAALYPDVAIERTVVAAEPADALLAAGKNAVLVVVGCHHSDDRWSTRLGAVPAAILHRSACPVVVVGQRHQAPVANGHGVLIAEFT